MNKLEKIFKSFQKEFNRHPEWSLVFGMILMGLAHSRFNVSLLGFICMVPFLWYISREGIRAKWLKFALALFVAWSFIVLKITTAPIPVYFVFLFSLPIALVHFPAYFIWGKFRNKAYGLFLFPAIMVLAEWIQYTFTPFGSWGTAAYTQASQSVMIQSLSLFGMAGLSFVVYAVNLMAFVFLVKGKHYRVLIWWVPLGVLVLMLYGEARIERYQTSPKATIKVAAIDTDSEIGGLPLPTKEKNTADFHTLLERTRRASQAGAKIVVWTEGAFLMPENQEAEWLDSIRVISLQNNIALFASHVKVVSLSPFQYANRYYFYDNGILKATYHKHEPVPGEPCIKGKEELHVNEKEGLRMGGAICYDYDFPYIAKAYGKLRADLVAVPSSDWRGIDPLHSEMAAFRAIEQGHSIVRSTRFGLSAAINPLGQFMGQMSSFDASDKIMIASLPAEGVRTVYQTMGDVVIILIAVYLGLFVYHTLRRFYTQHLCC